MAYDLIVKDEEYTAHSTNVTSRTEHVETTLQTMLDTLQSVVALEGALEGDTAQNFAAFIEVVALLKGKVSALGTQYQQLSESFIGDVDTCDQDIY